VIRVSDNVEFECNNLDNVERMTVANIASKNGVVIGVETQVDMQCNDLINVDQLTVTDIASKDGTVIRVSDSMEFECNDITNVNSIETGNIVGKDGLSISIDSNLDMECGNIDNLENLHVQNVFGKNSPFFVNDSFTMTDGGGDTGQIRFESGIAIGSAATVSAPSTISIGKLAYATGLHAIAIGTGFFNKSFAIGKYSMAVGYSTQALATGGTSFGYQSICDLQSTYGTALGPLTTVNRRDAIAVGHKSTANGNAAVVIGYSSGSYAGNYGIAIGAEAGTSQNNSAIAIGRHANCIGVGANYSIAIGSGPISSYAARVNQAYSIAIGYRSRVYGGINSIAIGHKTLARERDNIVIGYSAESTLGTQYGIAIGYKSIADGFGSVAFGRYTAAGHRSVALGFYCGSAASGTSGSAAVGYSSTITGSGYCSAVGIFNRVSSSSYCTALGNGIRLRSGSYVTVGVGYGIRNYPIAGSYNTTLGIGNGSVAADAVAIGNKAQAHSTGTISIGTDALNAGNGTMISSGDFVPSFSGLGTTGGVPSVTLTITSVISNTIEVGMRVSGAGIAPGTYIAGIAGVSMYTLSAPATVIPGTAITGFPMFRWAFGGPYPDLKVGSLLYQDGQLPTKVLALTQGTLGVVGSTYELSVDQGPSVSSTFILSDAQMAIAIGYKAGSTVYDGSDMSIMIGSYAEARGTSSVAIGTQAQVVNDYCVQLGEAVDSGANAKLKFRSQQVSNEEWIGGGLTLAAITNAGDIVRNTPDLDMQCNNIGNVSVLEVETILPKTGSSEVVVDGNLAVTGDLNVTGDISLDDINSDKITANSLCVTDIASKDGTVIRVSDNVEFECNNLDNVERMTVANIASKDGVVIGVENQVDG
jgi:hypothetical protein